MSQRLHPHDDSITLVVEDRTIECSRRILMSHSDYFHVMFSRNYRESNETMITLEGVDGRAMEDLMQVLIDISYYEKIFDIGKVIVLSDMFLFDNLTAKLAQETLKFLSPNNCLQIWMKLELIPVIPLVWKAKSMSLTNFNYLRKFGFINALVLTELITYLSHINLMCESEINVFHVVLDWIRSNNQSEVSFQEILGSVINFKDISIKELTEMKCRNEVMKYPDIVEILEYVIRLKCGRNVAQDKNSEIARSWLDFQGRYLPNYLCVLNHEQKLAIFCHEKWTKDTIQLPCCQTSLKYCDFNEKLFILDCHLKLGFFYANDESKWQCVDISESVKLEEYSSFSIFSYRGNLFFKGKQLIELEYIDDTLKPIKVHEIPNHTNDVLIETLTSYNRVYSAYTDHISGGISLEYLNLDDLSSLFFEHIGLYNFNQPLEAAVQLTYNPNSTMKMFMFHHHKLVFSEDILVDDG